MLCNLFVLSLVLISIYFFCLFFFFLFYFFFIFFCVLFFFFFFFQAEDGIRDRTVTGVQTCALPISFVSINCAAIPDSLVESELFGYERGAFTGAHAQKEGTLKQAAGGSAFFDEIEIGRASCRERV